MSDAAERPLQVLVLCLGPVDDKHQKIRSLEGCVCVCVCGGGRQTQVTLLVPWWPRARGHALTFHPPGTTDLEGIPPLQVPDQCISFVDQYDQFIQQQLLSSLLGFSFLPVCKIRGTFRL
ncbi:hypothetical protein CHARACLAT_006147 [Characodon lateralis]|uniref:Uncharacterized protein n=1 Tax=Characodon lateralis TaxID=208331 RepID=A0ABU7DSS1_9TELE|nr:hypothetical protein [Characodon lateralis]